MNMSKMGAFQGKRVLLLQGPIGPFFWRLSKDLVHAGAQVFKVNFNGGDWLFYPQGAINFRGHAAEWPAYLESILDDLNIDVIMLFGDCRAIHRVAHEIAHRRNLKIGVFEEGYLRPDYVTLELHGVNNHSLLPRTPEFYLNKPSFPIAHPVHVNNAYWYAALWAISYFFVAGLLKPVFSYYRHHRPLTWLEALPWIRSFWRKGYYMLKEYGALEFLTGSQKGAYYLVPLQVNSDAQVLKHSEFSSIIEFLEKTIASFALHASVKTTLVIKQHPMDRGYHDYSKLISGLARKFAVRGRCFYIHDQNLPSLLQNARGVVVINSTVGLSALHHGRPLKVCGHAIYNMAGLTFQGSLDAFWKDCQLAIPDNLLLQCFQGYLVNHTQLNGSFYIRLPDSTYSTGINWPSDEIVDEVTLKKLIGSKFGEHSSLA
jgi:capsular polysaccharide export protein